MYSDEPVIAGDHCLFDTLFFPMGCTPAKWSIQYFNIF